MEDGVLALILLAAFVALGRFAAEVYAANQVQRVSIVAMVVAAPFWLWALYNTVFDSPPREYFHPHVDAERVFSSPGGL